MKKKTSPFFNFQPLFIALFLSVFSFSCNNGSQSVGSAENPKPAKADSGSTNKVMAEPDISFCNWVKDQVSNYADDLDAMLQENTAFVQKNNKVTPIPKELGELYIQSFEDETTVSTGSDRTRAVAMEAKEIAYLLYCLYNKRKGGDAPKAQFAFARYDLARADGRDRRLSDDYKKDGHHTLIVGIRPWGTISEEKNAKGGLKNNFILPLEYGDTSFYDNWHEIWP